MIKMLTLNKPNLYRIGAVAAIVSALIFRRNIGAEITLFSAQSSPANAAEWFNLLESNRLLGLGFLNIFDIVNYALVGVLFLAVYVALRQTKNRYVAIATALGLVGTLVYFVTNTAFSMLSLSSQYATATTEAQKASLLTAGQTLLVNGDPGAIYEGTGGYVSMLLIAVAGLIISIVMLKREIFSKATGCVGICASAFDLAYIVGLVFVPAEFVELLSAVCLATAGFLLMVWHLLIGVKLYQLSKKNQAKEVLNQ